MKRRLELIDSPMANGIRLRNEHLTLEYRPDKPMLKSTGKNTHHLAKMGLRRADGDFLRIEEALYLAELGNAIVVDRHRNQLTVPQIFSLLCSMNVSFFKYAVYSQLVRAGYVVRNPSDLSSSTECSSSSNYAVKACAFHFSQQLLDQFPSIISSSDDRFAISLHIPLIRAVHDDDNHPTTIKLLHHQNNNDEQAVDDDNRCVTIENLNGQMNAHIRKIESFLLRDVRRQHSEPWNTCRPRWWPSLRSVHQLDSWRVYALRRDALMQTRRQQQHRMPPPTAVERSRSDSCFAYELFPDERSSTKPLYSVIIVEPYSTLGVPLQPPNFGELYKLVTECANHRDTQLLVANGSPNCVKISQFMAESDASLSVPKNGGNE